jgi:site-specific recombinase XerD
MLKIIRNILKKFIDDIDADNTNISYEQQCQILKVLSNVDIGQENEMSKTQAADYLGISRATFDNYIKDDIGKSFILPKAEVTDMEYLNSQESLIAAKVCDNEKRNPLRKKAMLVMFINTGMRASELANLKIEDIGEEWINVRSAKGNKFRRIPIHNSIKVAIDNYIKHERKKESPYLFVNQAGRKLSTVIINRDLNSIIKNSTIDKHISAHRLRDSFATIQYINGSDIKSIQETLGHSTIQMTLHYVQKVDERRKEQILNSGVQF